MCYQHPELTPTSELASANTPPERSRARISRACNPCRSRKIRCDGALPCTKCVLSNRRPECVYRSEEKTRFSKPSISRPIAPKTSVFNHARAGDDVSLDSSSQQPTAVDDIVTNKKHLELRAGIGARNSTGDAYQFYGPSSHISFVQRLYQRIRRQSHQPLMLSTEGLKKWGVDQALFTQGEDRARHQNVDREGKFLPRKLGESFIASYFSVIHPQAPILLEADVLETWGYLWTAPGPMQRSNAEVAKDKAILYLVLAIGARLAPQIDGAPSSSSWAEHFYERAANLADVFEETSLTGTHILVLRAIYGLQVGRPNWVYLSIGHAARSAVALGLHRSQVTDGTSVFANRLRLTFSTIYYMERMMAIFTGRPTSLQENVIDTMPPDDMPEGSDTRPTQYAYIRAMTVLGRQAEIVLNDNYLPARTKKLVDLANVNKINNECIAALDEMVQSLPNYLHFFDNTAKLGEEWQEVQRNCLGITYHIMRILIYRPSLVYVTFWDSKAMAQESIGDKLDLESSIEKATQSAKDLIELCYDTFFHRCPSMKRDGNMTFFIVSACLTLLFEVLDAETTPAHATQVFHVVEKALQCLETIDHIGSTTGRAISLDVMKVAKDAVFSTQAETRLGSNLIENFSWLNDDAMFSQLSQDTSSSWIYNSLSMPDMGGADLGMQTMFGQYLPGPSPSQAQSQVVLDLMREGMQFQENSLETTFMHTQNGH